MQFDLLSFFFFFKHVFISGVLASVCNQEFLRVLVRCRLSAGCFKSLSKRTTVPLSPAYRLAALSCVSGVTLRRFDLQMHKKKKACETDSDAAQMS